VPEPTPPPEPAHPPPAISRQKLTSDVWWKNAMVYCLDVQTFLDADGNGSGDFVGLTERVDYLAGMGVTCVWLMPFHPSPGRDDGYDIVDHFAVDPRLGTLGDLTDFVRTARDHGIRVTADLVVNHTSHRHPWFRAARSDRRSPFRDFYVWRDERPDQPLGKVIFPGVEQSNWAWDEEAGQFYLHRFFAEQPDLNVANPYVRDAIAQIAGFWLQPDLSGFRIDAVPYLIEGLGMPEGAVEDPHELLRELRAYLRRRRGTALLLGEVNLPVEQQLPFFGGPGGDELSMIFSLPVNQAMFLALARQDARPLAAALRALPELPPECQWANFVRNHDELNLSRLSPAEREEVFAAFGPEERFQMFGRGLRRRLPPMLGGDARRIRMVYSLMLSLPGTPVLFYGEEIGMSENLDIEGRLSVRSPMQWSPERHAGFSGAPEDVELSRPLVRDEHYGPRAVNVADQRRDADSLLNWMERRIRRRKECPEVGWGTFAVLATGEDAVLAHRCDWDTGTFVAAHNLADTPVRATLELGEAADAAGLVDLFGRDELPVERSGRVHVELEPYGARWYRPRRGDRPVGP
jgi:trehalose synthase